MPSLPDDNARIRLDDVSLQARASLYPEELREPFLWLGAYLRNECHRDIDVLVNRLKPLKVTIDKTNWSKILRGRWDRDAHDQPLEHPVVALSKLLAAIEALRKSAQRKAQGGGIGYILTPVVGKMITNYLDKKWAPDRVNKLGVVIGETGTQKTATFRHFQRENNHGACVWLDFPETPSLYKFKTALAICYAGPGAAQTSSPKKDQIIENSVSERNMIIAENMQRGFDDDAEGDQSVFSYIQRLVELKGCAFILSFTPTFETRFRAARTRGFLEQFEGRAGGSKSFLRLPEFPPEEDVLAITKAYGLLHAEKHNDYCTALAAEPGRIRILMETLQDAKILAETKRESLTVGHLKTVREEE
jgi:hypothetical protein